MITVKMIIVTVITVKIVDFFVYEGFLKFKTTLQSYTNDVLRRNVKRDKIYFSRRSFVYSFLDFFSRKNANIIKNCGLVWAFSYSFNPSGWKWPSGSTMHVGTLIRKEIMTIF